ncbi:hypothetical protein [Arhodomonas sp. AD133]|uniref:hypothetical protein n=1 Tax=Arhodomonas sp. AD133 TaxID=3415009 RepID=UPI003EBF3F0C
MELDEALLRELIDRLQRLDAGETLPVEALTEYAPDTVAVHMHWLRNAGLATASGRVGRPDRLTGLTAASAGLCETARDDDAWAALVERLRRYPAHQVATALYALTRR